MFIEVSREKMFVIFVIVALIGGCIAIFSLANNIFDVLPQVNYSVSRQESGFMYWLLYKLPDVNAAAIATTTPSGNAKSIPVLLYHGEGATSDMPLSVFVDQMRALKGDGWTTITMEQYEEWEKGEIQLPDKSFLLTFDDGRKDTYYQADPVLQDMGFNAIMFVITGFSMPADGKSSNFYLNATELSEMAQSGRWELESHGDLDHATYAVQTTTDLTQSASTTQGHFLSNKFWNAQTNTFETNAQFTQRVDGDLIASKQTLEQDFGGKVIAFAYPFNDFGQDTVNFSGSQAILDKTLPAVYTYAFYQTWPQNGDTFNYPLTNNGPGSTAYMEKRIEPDPSWSGADLIAALDAGSPKPLPYQQSGTFGQEWVQAWGVVSSSNEGLVLSADPATSGSDAFLNGSGWWKNYYFSATMDWQTSASSIALIVRNLDDQDNADCTFTPSEIVIDERMGDAQTAVARASVHFSPSANAHLGVNVSGNTLTCYENGVPVVSGAVANMPTHGGIGVEVWNKTLDAARSVLKSVSVTNAI